MNYLWPNDCTFSGLDDNSFTLPYPLYYWLFLLNGKLDGHKTSWLFLTIYFDIFSIFFFTGDHRGEVGVTPHTKKIIIFFVGGNLPPPGGRGWRGRYFWVKFFINLYYLSLIFTLHWSKTNSRVKTHPSWMQNLNAGPDRVKVG